MRLRTDDVCIVSYGLLPGCAVYANRDELLLSGAYVIDKNVQ